MWKNKNKFKENMSLKNYSKYPRTSCENSYDGFHQDFTIDR